MGEEELKLMVHKMALEKLKLFYPMTLFELVREKLINKSKSRVLMNFIETIS